MCFVVLYRTGYFVDSSDKNSSITSRLLSQSRLSIIMKQAPLHHNSSRGTHSICIVSLESNEWREVAVCFDVKHMRA